MAIRYDSQLRGEIRRTVKAFNAKVRRLEAKGVSAALLPDSVSSKEIQQGFQNRKDLRTRLQQLQEFTSAGETFKSEGGLVGTNKLFMYRQGEANKAVKEINKQYQKTLQLDTRYPMMQGEYVNNLKSKMDYLSRDIQKMDVSQVKIFNKNLLTPEERSKRNETFYQNYIKMVFYDGYRGAIDPDTVKELTDLIYQIPPEKLLELYNTNPAIRGIADKYIEYKMQSGTITDAELQDYLNSATAVLLEELNKLRK